MQAKQTMPADLEELAALREAFERRLRARLMEVDDTQRGNEHDKKLPGTGAVGERHHAAKLTDEKVCEIRRRYQEGERCFTTLAKSYGVKRYAIRDIVRRRTWRHI